MATPAEIIAARINGIIKNSEGLVNDASMERVSDSEDVLSTTINSGPILPSAATTPSIGDESAFPALGGKKSSIRASTPSWGPSMKTPRSSVSPASSKSSTPVVGNTKLKVSTIQEAFSLDSEDQLNTGRTEFIKILTSIKTQTKTNIECTTSLHTNKRTFLITGKHDDVKIAKRLILKKLTRPVKINFTIPAAVRSKIIGQQGRTVKAIISENDVKIDIGQLEEGCVMDEDDIYLVMVNVDLEGDIEGCMHAKAQILSVVEEETKYMSAKIPLTTLVKPFALKELEKTVERYPTLDFSIPDYRSKNSHLTIIGEREQVFSAKEEIKEHLENLEKKIVTEAVPIPKVKHQFLPIDKILETYNVLIQLPEDSEGKVKFSGEKSKIKQAQESARNETSQYKVEVLEMSKAHKGNLKHVKAVAYFFSQNGTFQTLSAEHDVVINVPSKEDLANENILSVPIEIVVTGEKLDNVKLAKKTIVSVVNKLSPDDTKVINDIDEFLVARIPQVIDNVVHENNLSYTLLGDTLTLFCNGREDLDEFDFVDSSESSEAFEKVNKRLDVLRELGKDLRTVVMQIPSSDQSILLEPRGSTLKLITESVDPNSCLVKLHSNGLKISDNEVYIHGLDSSVQTIMLEIENTLKGTKLHSETGNYVSVVEVPSHCLSRLIGKNGSNMILLRNDYEVKIDVEDNGKAEEPNNKMSKTNISILGPYRNVEACKDAIVETAKKWADEKLVHLKIENQFHRRLIGPNGIYINKLQDKYQVKIKFPNSHNDGESPDLKSKDEVIIRGPSRGVDKAQEELKELYKYEQENGFKETLKIPSTAISRVIGKSGETINDIADGCGIKYKFSRNAEEEKKLGYTVLELTGSKSALKDAGRIIDGIIDEVENFVTMSLNVDPKYYKYLIGQGGSTMREIIAKAGGENVARNKYFKLLVIPNESLGSTEITSQGDKAIVSKIIEQVKDIVATKEAAITVDIELPKEKHRLLVGPAGSIRHSLQDEFDISVHVPKPSDPSSSIQLQGLPEKIEQAKLKIAELTKDDWVACIEIPECYHSLVSERGAIFKLLESNFNIEISHGNQTRNAATLSSAHISNPPESAYPLDDENIKFTIVENNIEETPLTITWRLKGRAEDAEGALKVIKERLDSAKNSNRQGWLYYLKPSLFNKVVGPQGSTINQIRTNSKVFITVPRPHDKNCNFIYLLGSEDNLLVAESAIKSILGK